jgi:MFS family permease
MSPVAMVFGVLDLTGSAALVGVVIAARTAAQVSVQLFGGALADRWPRRARRSPGRSSKASARARRC